MNIPSYHENVRRGTPDFPIELYSVSQNHPKYPMQMHWHKDFEIIRIIKGSFELTLNENRFTLTGGQSVIIPGGIIHGGTPQGCFYECIVFSAGILYAAQKCRSLVKNYMQSPVIYNESADIERIFEIFSKKEQGYELELIGLLYRLAGDIVKNQPDISVLPNEKIEKIKAAIAMIEENYSRKITLSELAEVCRMSPNYFSRFFKKITRQTPFEYIVTYRIEAACEMLSGGSDNVTDVCYSCGFNDLSYFIHIFKEHKGMSPKAYARLQAEKAALPQK